MNQNRKKPEPLEANILFTNLRGMIGKRYIFEGKGFIITDVIEYGTAFKIYTTAGNKVLTPDQANDFIAEVEYVDTDPPQAATPSVLQPKMPMAPAPVEQSKQGAMIDSMTDALFEVFQTIREAPTKENIDMGTALSNTANTVCNMMKLKLQAEKLSRK